MPLFHRGVWVGSVRGSEGAVLLSSVMARVSTADSTLIVGLSRTAIAAEST